MAKTYHIITIGCAMNQSDSERLASRLNELGWCRVSDCHRADLVVLVTCGVRQSAEDRIYGLINQIKKANPKTAIAITGCLVYRQDIKTKLQDKVIYWFSINELGRLEQILPCYNPDNIKPIKDYLEIMPDYKSRVSTFVPIGNGCNNFCSYCVVPYARGREIYRPAQDIIVEVQQLLNKGYQEITIIAQNVNSYKDELNGLDFTGLLEKLDSLGDYWLRFATSHPKDMSDRLINFLGQSHNLIHHLHLPVQSGSNKILKAMNRNYTAEYYRTLINKVRQQWPDIILTTDIIVGFPGETDKDFADTIQLVKDLKFDQVYVARYSPRPGTLAAKMADDVPAQVKKKREQQLNQMVIAGALKNRQAQIGQRVMVLLEEQRGDCYFGHTDHGLQILVTTPEKKSYTLGLRYFAQITSARSFSLAGQLFYNKSMVNNNHKAVAVIGPTAAGKTKLAVALASKYHGEIISADSRQVYRGMNIGTGKDLDDYYNNGHPIPYHLIDIVEPTENFDVATYQRLARQALNNILTRGHLPIVAGGSGLYLQALIDNYEFNPAKPDTALRQDLEKLSAQELYQKLNNLAPALASKLNNSDRHNPRRLIRYLEIILNKPTISPPRYHDQTNWLILGIDYPMEILEQRIYDRLIERLENEDMIEEVYHLHEEGVDWHRLESFGLEYRFISRYLREQLDYDQMVEQLYIAIRQFAKRQKSWFKRWEKQGREIHWLNINNPLQEAESLIDNFL